MQEEALTACDRLVESALSPHQKSLLSIKYRCCSPPRIDAKVERKFRGGSAVVGGNAID